MRVKLEKFFSIKNIILILILVGFILYVNSLPNKMFWDDNDSILNNRYIKDFKYLPYLFSQNLIAGAGLLSNYWRPVLLLIFSFEWHIFKTWSPGYHFVNVLFHITNSILLFLILLYVFRNIWVPFLTSLIFLSHPLQTEAVTYVSGLGDPLSVFFIFLGIIFYLKYRDSHQKSHKSPAYFLSLFMYILSLMSKESAIVFPGLLLLLDIYILKFQFKNPIKRIIKELLKNFLPFAFIASIYILLRATVLNFINTFNLYNQENIFTSHFYVRLFTFFRILTVYFKLLFLPLGLHMERSVEIATSLNSFSVILGLGLVITSFILAIYFLKKIPEISIGIFWFYIALFPFSNLIVPINGLLYEHWLYLPMIGIFLSLFFVGLRISKKNKKIKTGFIGLFLIFFIFLSILTIDRNRDWRDPITFYTQTLKYAPNSYRVINNLGMAYADNREFDKAIEMYKKAIDLDPNNPVAFHNLANAYKTLGKIDLAIKNYQLAIEKDPKFLFSYNALTDIYLKTKEYDKAIKTMEKYLRYTNSKIDTLILLAKIAEEAKEFSKALEYLEEAEKLDPGNKYILSHILYIKNLINLKEK